MKTFFLIDGTNNNKVVNEFDSQEEAMAYVDLRKNIENWENSYETFEDYKDEFFTVDSEQMAKAIKTYGRRKRDYWN